MKLEASTEAADALRVLTPYLEPRSYRAGQVLWIQGEASGRLVLLHRGRVKAVKALSDGSSVLLYVFSGGISFGFLPFLDGGGYPATAIAVDDVEAQVMSRSTLRRAIAADPKIAMVLLATLGTRLRQAFDRLGDQSQRTSVARVAAALSLLLPAGEHTAHTVIDVPNPIQDFAADVGMTPETFSRAVTRLVDAGLLHRLASPRLQVLDLTRLRHAASGKSYLDSDGRA